MAFEVHTHISVGSILRNEIAGSKGMYMLNFRRCYQIAFQSSCTNLTNLFFHQWCLNVPVVPHPCQHLVLSVFFILALPTSILNKLLVIFLIPSPKLMKSAVYIIHWQELKIWNEVAQVIIWCGTLLSKLFKLRPTVKNIHYVAT